MASTYYGRKGPNRLLQGMILVSLGIHTLVFMHITGLYRSRALEFIELTLQEDPNRFNRAIPRPPQLPKENEEFEKPKPFQITPVQSPDVSRIAIDPSDFGTSSGLMEGIGMPTKQDYYEMVRLKIERHKKYPDEAASMRKQGKVVLSFVINLEGVMRDLKIVKPSPHEVLNEAALQAVRDCNPFLRPPPRLFKEDILIELDVNFELL